MKLSDYWRDMTPALLVSLTSALLFSGLLWLFGIGSGELALLWLCFLGIGGSFLLWRYCRQRKRLQYLQSLIDSLDQKYLLAEIAKSPASALEQAYFQWMKTALKAMTDEVSKAQRQNREYRDFVEQWVHEMKVPVTGIQLLCQNNKSDVTRRVMAQAELISQGVERVLFYARIGSVEKDYFIREVSLKDCMGKVLAESKQLLIQNSVSVSTEALSHLVYTDEKWLAFIIHQLLVNSVKYQGTRPPAIVAASQDHGSYVTLSVTDNGIGIKESELGRVFDKGFVGSNGRAGKNATGIGLYLCAQLCSRLGIGIEITSKEGEFTTVLLHFPKGDYLKV